MSTVIIVLQNIIYHKSKYWVVNREKKKKEQKIYIYVYNKYM